jgi:hypothetical protein
LLLRAPLVEPVRLVVPVVAPDARVAPLTVAEAEFAPLVTGVVAGAACVGAGAGA